MSIVKDYYAKHKFNVMEISNSKHQDGKDKERGERLTEKESR